MITFSMRREGQFTARFNTRGNQCGTGGQQIYTYLCEIEVGEKLDNRGFILDNYEVQGYFDRTYASDQPAQSCERIAQIAASHFADLLQRNGREAQRVSVTIRGSAFAGLTASWTPEKEISVDPRLGEVKVFGLTPPELLERINFWDQQHSNPVGIPGQIVYGDFEKMNSASLIPSVQPDLGEADVWHNGSRSYYRARLLKRLTPEEANFDPTDPEPVEVIVCDHCHKPVELDGGELFGNMPKGREDYKHKGADWRCAPGLTQATVNGQEYVIKTPAEPTPEQITREHLQKETPFVKTLAPKPVTPVCDHCDEEVQPDSDNRWWQHVDSTFYRCDLPGPRREAQVNGTDEVEAKPTPVPAPAPVPGPFHKFTIERAGHRVCEVCSLSDVYVRSQDTTGKPAQTQRVVSGSPAPVCDYCKKSVEVTLSNEAGLKGRWIHKESHLYGCYIDQTRNEATFNGSLSAPASEVAA